MPVPAPCPARPAGSPNKSGSERDGKGPRRQGWDPGAARADIDGDKMDGFVARPRKAAAARARNRRAARARPPARARASTRWGITTRARPPTTGPTRRTCGPGPHVRAQRLVEPARAPVPGLGVVGVPGLGVVGVLHRSVRRLLVQECAPDARCPSIRPRSSAPGRRTFTSLINAIMRSPDWSSTAVSCLETTGELL